MALVLQACKNVKIIGSRRLTPVFQKATKARQHALALDCLHGAPEQAVCEAMKLKLDCNRDLKIAETQKH